MCIRDRPVVDPDVLAAEQDQLPGQQIQLRIAARRQITASVSIAIP